MIWTTDFSGSEPSGRGVPNGGAVGAGGEVDVYLAGSDLSRGRLGRVLPGLIPRARDRLQLFLIDYGNSVPQLRVLDGGLGAEQDRPR